MTFEGTYKHIISLRERILKHTKPDGKALRLALDADSILVVVVEVAFGSGLQLNQSCYYMNPVVSFSTLTSSVAHESRILAETLGLASMFLSCFFSLRLATSRFTRAVSSTCGEVRQCKTVAESARARRLFGTTILTPGGCPGGNC
jgi:hypothetical protein